MQPEELKVAKQLAANVVLPIPKTFKPEKARVPSADERKHNAFIALRQARITAKLHGLREKKKKEAEDKDK